MLEFEERSRAVMVNVVIVVIAENMHRMLMLHLHRRNGVQDKETSFHPLPPRSPTWNRESDVLIIQILIL